MKKIHWGSFALGAVALWVAQYVLLSAKARMQK